MLEQTIPGDTVQKRTDGATGRIKSICVAYQANENFLRNILRGVPAIAHSKHKPVNIGMPPAIEQDESLFVAPPHSIQQSFVTELGPQTHPLLFNVMRFLSYSSAGKAISSKIFADFSEVSKTQR
jgi:hypothetical protein